MGASILVHWPGATERDEGGHPGFFNDDKVIDENLVPRLVHVVDLWFPQFSSLEVAMSLLEIRWQDLCLFNKPSPAYDGSHAKLARYLERARSNAPR